MHIGSPAQPTGGRSAAPGLAWRPTGDELLSAELGEPVTFRVAAERHYLERLTGAGCYLVPVKVAVQRAEAIGEGAIVEVVVRLNAARRQ